MDVRSVCWNTVRRWLLFSLSRECVCVCVCVQLCSILTQFHKCFIVFVFHPWQLNNYKYHQLNCNNVYFYLAYLTWRPWTVCTPAYERQTRWKGCQSGGETRERQAVTLDWEACGSESVVATSEWVLKSVGRTWERDEHGWNRECLSELYLYTRVWEGKK